MIHHGLDRFPRDTRYILAKHLARSARDRPGIDLIRGVIVQVYKRNKRRMIKAYYGYSTGVNGMDIREILEHFPNIRKGIIFVFSVLRITDVVNLAYIPPE